MKVIVVIFGASSGLTVGYFAGGKFCVLVKAKIPFRQDANGIKYWPLAWLKKQLAAVMEYAQPGDIVAPATWGADYAAFADDSAVFGGMNLGWAKFYASVPEHYLKQVTDIIPAEELYLRTGGANVDWFQMYSQLKCDLGLQANVLLAKTTTGLIPMADVITYLLTGQKGHDQTMLKSYGLTEPGWRKIYLQLFGSEIANKIAPWPVFPENQLLTRPNGVRVCPTTHDSVPSRRVGFTLCPWDLWTGTWGGDALDLTAFPNVTPSKKSFGANVAFEGIGNSAAAITNFGMFGTIWDAIKTEGGWPSYDAIAQSALEFLGASEISMIMGNNPTPNLTRMMEHLEKTFSAGNWPLKAAYFITVVAQICKNGLEGTAKLFDLPKPVSVAVTGGWTENEAFLAQLENLGIAPLIPPLATEATHAGVAAQALVMADEANTFAEALELLASM
ncbi:MAG: hypothetical protein WC508_03270 [Patescibacteria group bacterium]